MIRLILRRNTEEVNVLQTLTLSVQDKVRHHHNTCTKVAVLKRSRSVRVGAGVIRIVHKRRRNRGALTVLIGQLRNVQGRRTGGHQHTSNLHQVLILLTVKTVTVRGFLEEAEENRHIRGIGRHLNGHALFVEITMTITVTGAHSLEDFVLSARKINNLSVRRLHLARSQNRTATSQESSRILIAPNSGFSRLNAHKQATKLRGLFLQRRESLIKSHSAGGDRSVRAVQVAAGSAALNGCKVRPAVTALTNYGVTIRFLKTCPNIGLKNIAHPSSVSELRERKPGAPTTLREWEWAGVQRSFPPPRAQRLP